MYVRDLMTGDVVAAGLGDSVSAACEVMLERGVRYLPVTDPHGKLVGVLTHRDIAVRFGLDARDDLATPPALLERCTVGEVMSDPVDTVDPDDALALAAEILLERRISCLPVVEGTRLVGLLTESDFVRLVLDQLDGRR